MFEVGWTEMLVIAVVMIVVVGPKDLPQMLRQFGRTTAKLRAMAGDFRKQFDEALKEAELDDVKKSVDSLRSLNPTTEIRKQLNPFQQAAQDIRSGLETAMKPKPAEPSQPASPAVHEAEPLKNGAADMPAAEPFQPAPAAPVSVPVMDVPPEHPALMVEAGAPIASPQSFETSPIDPAPKAKRAPRKRAVEVAPDAEAAPAPRARKRPSPKSAETPT
ncbi:MAG: twin-arginine translocase subunit TatB [Methylobacterium mesophilicum]|nr:twin-arginine translocase subunit TatB [Methylobacterium mesophilicum]